jgi:hypothetical protein
MFDPRRIGLWWQYPFPIIKLIWDLDEPGLNGSKNNETLILPREETPNGRKPAGFYSFLSEQIVEICVPLI